VCHFFSHDLCNRSRDSILGTATSYGPDGRGVQIPVG
jgi:hypothetical protein